MFASGQIDFVCVPVDFKHCASDGFAFINLLSLEQNNFEDVPFCAGAIETVMTQSSIFVSSTGNFNIIAQCFEEVSFSMPGRTSQDVSVVMQLNAPPQEEWS